LFRVNGQERILARKVPRTSTPAALSFFGLSPFETPSVSDFRLGDLFSSLCVERFDDVKQC
jgi:hypothetical protein